MILAVVLSLLLIAIVLIEFRAFKRGRQLKGWLWWVKGSESDHESAYQIMESGSLMRYLPFRRALFWPVFMALLVTISIVWAENLGYSNLCTSSACWARFVSIFKVPISLLAIAVPLGAWAVANHRAKLTFYQIEAAEEQNRFANYFHHREVFRDFLSLDEMKVNYIDNQESLYKFLFGDPDDFHLDGSVALYNLLRAMTCVVDNINNLDSENSLLSHNMYNFYLLAKRCGICQLSFSLDQKRNVLVGLDYTHTIYNNPSVHQVVDSFRGLLSTIIALSDFPKCRVRNIDVEVAAKALQEASYKQGLSDISFNDLYYSH